MDFRHRQEAPEIELRSNMRISNLFCSFWIALALIACNTIETIDPIPDSPLSRPDPNRFERLQTKSSTRVYRRVGASLTPYSKILLQPLDIELRSGWNPGREDQSKIDIQNARLRIATMFQ